MGEIIIPNAVKRKPGFLYYIDGDGNICEAELSRNGGAKKIIKDDILNNEKGGQNG